jgi:hypothetical protein
MIGANAITDGETRHVLSIIRAAFEKPDRVPESANNPSATLFLLRNLAKATEEQSLQKQIAQTMAYVQAQ